MLRLEDLTRGDIALYVRDKLESHPRFKLLQDKDIRYQDLVQQLVNKSAGVYLWVFLVVRSLLRGFTHGDRVSDLQRRVSLLPADLESYFRQILDSVEDVYQSQTLKMFHYALRAPPSGPIPLIIFSHLDEEDPDFAVRLKPRFTHHMNTIDIKMREEEMLRRLDGRTKGLLEVPSVCIPYDYLQDEHRYRVTTVDFLQRTVKDFLLTREMRKMLEDGVDRAFSPDLDLCKVFLAHWKLNSDRKDPIDYQKDVLHYAYEVELRNTQLLTIPILNEAERMMSLEDLWIVQMEKRGGFVSYLIGYNLKGSVAHRLEVDPNLLSNPTCRSSTSLSTWLSTITYDITVSQMSK